MPTRRQFLKFAGGGSLAAFSWMTRDDGDIREVYQAIPGRQGPREKRGQPPTQPMPEFTAATHPDYAASDIHETEQTHFEGLNDYRSDEGLDRLEWSDNLAYIARRYSLEQSTEGFTGHYDDTNQGWEFYPDGEVAASLTDRLDAYGYQTEKMLYSENAMWRPFSADELDERGGLQMDSQEPIADIALDDFKGSPSHNAAMLDERYDTVGVGVTLAQTPYRSDRHDRGYLDLRVTQVFTGPMEGFDWVIRS
jgi:uncharacterized protein YkwD